MLYKLRFVESLHSFLTDNVITYIGNKRTLLGFIDTVIAKIIATDPKLSNLPADKIKFFDIFSGSGVVSRLSKARGFTTFSNDLEVYTAPIADAFINTGPEDLDAIFEPVVACLVSSGKLAKDIAGAAYQAVLNYLNETAGHYIQKDGTGAFVRDVPADARYFCDHYAPADTNNVDFNTERLFYTQENARIVDIMISEINDETLFSPHAKSIILAELLYLMSKHNNTSGIMKGYHNGWGGRQGSAIDRIMAPIKLSGLKLLDGPKGRSFVGLAEEVFANNKDFFDENRVNIIYADPPYNQHQYSANYHLLTTAVQNDRYQPGAVVQGSRAGIRRDHNRSDFCYKKSVLVDDQMEAVAMTAFKKFITSVQGKADYLLVSYNNEGIIKHSELLRILRNEGRNTVTFKTKLHDKYKGGRCQNAVNKVSEFLFVVALDKPVVSQSLHVTIEVNQAA